MKYTIPPTRKKRAERPTDDASVKIHRNTENPGLKVNTLNGIEECGDAYRPSAILPEEHLHLINHLA